jgi:hypothetical protein
MVLSLSTYLAEAAAGIQHLDHIADHAFDGNEGMRYAHHHLKRAAEGDATITKKIDGSPSFQMKKHPDGKFGVKYKGAGASYNYSHEDIERQHGHKRYLAEPLHALLSHGHKILPHGEGEYQGDFMSTPKTRHEDHRGIGHKPNTIDYRVHSGSEEGKRLKRSKVSFALFSRLHPSGGVSPIHDRTGFRSHPDVHWHSHLLNPGERRPDPEHRALAHDHLRAAKHLIDSHDDSHIGGHQAHLRAYVHSTVSSGARTSTKGYAKFIKDKHDKEIEKVKTEKSKQEKMAKRDDALAHIAKHKKAFDATFEAHHHLQQAANHIARGIRGYPHTMKGDIGDEGYVHYDEANRPSKIVDREGFTRHNRARSDEIRGRGKK